VSEQADASDPRGDLDKESLADVLASIRALVSAEAAARVEGRPSADVVLLTPAMRVDRDAPIRSGELLAEGLEDLATPARAAARPAPILDEEALRELINRIVREELQGELGDRISRNLRKLIRREIAQILEEGVRD
jgi:hypothetical protein